MPLISKSEIIFAFFAGGLFGIAIAVAIKLMIVREVVTPLEVLTGAFLGTARLIAIIMIKNASPRRGSD